MRDRDVEVNSRPKWGETVVKDPQTDPNRLTVTTHGPELRINGGVKWWSMIEGTGWTPLELITL